MFKFERTARKAKKPDMTPLIDVIFQLILFFMLTTTFVKIEAIDLFVSNKAPQVQPTPAEIKFAQLSLKPEGIYLNGKKFDKAKKYNLSNVKITTEKGVSVQRLIDAVDILKTAGATNVVLDTTDAQAVAQNAKAPLAPIPMPELQSTKLTKKAGQKPILNLDNH